MSTAAQLHRYAATIVAQQPGIAFDVANMAYRIAAENATYTKLRDGSWGIKVPGKAVPGQQVTVETRAGARKQEVVGIVMWTGADRFSGGTASLCTIGVKGAGGMAPRVPGEFRPVEEPASYQRSPYEADDFDECAECGVRSRGMRDCVDSSGITGPCCPRCARMSRYERSFA